MAYNILIVDDSETTRAVIKKCLSMTGIELAGIYEASDGAAALRVLDQNWMDIVFADLNMPGMDGIALINAMAKMNMLESMPVVIITSDRNEARIEELKKVGARGYLSKPFRPEMLENMLREVLGSPDEPAAVGEVQIGETSSTEMGDDLSDIVGDAAMRVLEDAAYVFTERLPDDAENPLRDERKIVSAQIDIGSGRACVAFACSLCFAGTVAADLLGLDTEGPVPSRKCMDAIGELLNMLGGVLYKQWRGTTETEGLLGLPSVALLSYQEHSQRCGVKPLRLLLQTEDGDTVEVSFAMKG